MLFCVEFYTTGLDIYTTVVALLVIVTFGVGTCAGTGAGAGVGGFYTIGAGAGATGVLLAIVVFEVVADFPSSTSIFVSIRWGSLRYKTICHFS